MKRPEILELAMQFVERKGEKVLNLNSIYTLVLQDICKRERFWWRRVQFNFNATANTQTFDLTTIATVPTNAMTEILLDEITKFTIILTPNPFQAAEFVYVSDPEALISMINNTQPAPPNNPSTQFPGAGGRYTIDPSGINVIRIDPLDINYTAYVVGWAMPNPATDSTNDAVPLIPAWGHNAIVEGMKSYIFDWAYGEDSSKATKAAKRYEQAIQDLAQRKQPDPNFRLQLALSEAAVRST